MKKTLFLAAILILGIGFGCDKPILPGKKQIIANHSDCKTGFINQVNETSVETEHDILNYELKNSADLSIQHINAGFNCCITKVTCDTQIINKELIITETETLENSGCMCNCLYDLDYTIQNIDTSIRRITIVELYADPADTALSFPVDFSIQKKGSFITYRVNYPWGL